MAAAWKPLGPVIEMRANAMQPGIIPDTPESSLTRTFKQMPGSPANANYSVQVSLPAGAPGDNVKLF